MPERITIPEYLGRRMPATFAFHRLRGAAADIDRGRTGQGPRDPGLEEHLRVEPEKAMQATRGVLDDFLPELACDMVVHIVSQHEGPSGYEDCPSWRL